MKTTKKSIVIDRTDRCRDMLVQGGVCGQVLAYPLAEVLAQGYTMSDVADADQDDLMPDRDVSWVDFFEWLCPHPRVIRRGVRIE